MALLEQMFGSFETFFSFLIFATMDTLPYVIIQTATCVLEVFNIIETLYTLWSVAISVVVLLV